ncbi:unnamed protein product [Peronospora destructor]|uniref:RxLR effector protein n=1 Tax=Peronospora destructor TaxID=86335 RepID=A0AAV0V8D7_9STRA|nr:unnamed protein product [Peronospora destructor]
MVSKPMRQTTRRLLLVLLNLQHQLLQVLMMAPHWSSSTLASRTVRPTQGRLRFDLEDEEKASSPAPASTHLPVREYDDVPSHREGNCRGTISSVGTTQEALDRNVLRLAPELKPWLLLERLINDLSGETSAHHRIPLFDARRLHGLDISANNFRAEEDYLSRCFHKHR